MFCTRVAWACLVCLLLCKEEGSSPVSLQLLRGGIWACMRCPCLCHLDNAIYNLLVYIVRTIYNRCKAVHLFVEEAGQLLFTIVLAIIHVTITLISNSCTSIIISLSISQYRNAKINVSC